MSYINSEKLIVFPSSLRSLYGTGKFTSEENITGIIKTVTDYPSFIISWGPSEDPAENTASFVINGYYFNLSWEDGEVSTNNNLWASIYVEEETMRLLGWDEEINNQGGAATLQLDKLDNDKFLGLRFTTTDPGDKFHKLQILAGGKLIEENKKKFDLGNAYITINEGGTTKEVSIGDIINQIISGAQQVGNAKWADVAGALGKRNPETGAVELLNVGSEIQPVYIKNGEPKEALKFFRGTAFPPQTTADMNNSPIGSIFIVYNN